MCRSFASRQPSTTGATCVERTTEFDRRSHKLRLAPRRSRRKHWGLMASERDMQRRCAEGARCLTIERHVDQLSLSRVVTSWCAEDFPDCPVFSGPYVPFTPQDDYVIPTRRGSYEFFAARIVPICCLNYGAKELGHSGTRGSSSGTTTRGVEAPHLALAGGEHEHEHELDARTGRRHLTHGDRGWCERSKRLDLSYKWGRGTWLP